MLRTNPHDFKEKVHYSLSQDCSNGWSMGRARLKFVVVSLLKNIFTIIVASLLKEIYLPGVVVVFATIYWIMGISKYISG